MEPRKWSNSLPYKRERESLVCCNNRECISYSTASILRCSSKCAKELLGLCPLYRPAKGIVYKLQNLGTGLFFNEDNSDDNIGSCYVSGWKAREGIMGSGVGNPSDYEVVEFFLIENSRFGV